MFKQFVAHLSKQEIVIKDAQNTTQILLLLKLPKNTTKQQKRMVVATQKDQKTTLEEKKYLGWKPLLLQKTKKWKQKPDITSEKHSISK